MHSAFFIILQDILIGTSLAADAFSVSLCMGLTHANLTRKNATTLGCFFGGFQFLMPMLGGLVALFVGNFFGPCTRFVSCALILYVAINMLREAFSEHEACNLSLKLGNLFLLAVATSLDAFAVGFSIGLKHASPFVLAIVAGAITYALSYIGAMLGKKIGAGIGKKGEILGGVVLLIIAVTMLFD